MIKHSLWVRLLAATMLLSVPAHADVLTSFTSASAFNFAGYFGQSVTTPSGGPFDDLAFNFISANDSPVAFGTLYIFSSLYTGGPDALSGAGALASSTGISGGEYLFSPSATLAGDQQYFFYADGFIPLEFITGDFGGGSQYAPSASTDFGAPEPISADFILSGDPVSVPEPLTISLFGVGIAGAVAIQRRKKA